MVISPKKFRFGIRNNSSSKTYHQKFARDLPSPLSGTGLLLDRHDLQHLILQGGAKEQVDDLVLLQIRLNIKIQLGPVKEAADVIHTLTAKSGHSSSTGSFRRPSCKELIRAGDAGGR